nr:hypothetical protein [uncultured Lichenicoccus sp.]
MHRRRIRRPQHRFDVANTSDDGHLTLAQAQARGLRMVSRHFDVIDVGHRRYVTLDDVRQFTQARHAARQSQAAATEPVQQEPMMMSLSCTGSISFEAAVLLVATPPRLRLPPGPSRRNGIHPARCWIW